MEMPTNATIFAVVGALSLSYIFCTSIYNLYFHPLRKIPGPKMAAMGYLYEFYYDVIKDGLYLWEIEKMHEKYGPIVRINPKEIHIADPEYYSTIYTGTSRIVEKDRDSVGAFDVPASTAATVDHNLHRARRGYLSPYFSKRAIVGLEPVIHERISRLFERMDEYMREDKVLSLDGCFSAMTADVITTRFYGAHYDYLGRKDFKFVVRDAFLGLSLVYHLARFVPPVIKLLKSLPIPVVRMIMPAVADLLSLRDEIKLKGVVSLKETDKSEYKSIIVGAMGNHHIPAEERSVDRLVDEGIVIIFAGTETTSRALSVTMFYLLNDKSLLKKLCDEFDTLPFMPDNVYGMAQLQALPFLTGVVYEGLRLSFGPVSRLPRVSVHETLDYKEYQIPPGTPVSLSSYFVHTDPTIYPDPHSFEPERWIKAAKEGVALNRFIANFAKGKRQCLGVNMALSELYMTITRILKTYKLELEDTTMEDIKLHHVRIVGYPKAVKGNETRGEVQVKVLGRR